VRRSHIVWSVLAILCFVLYIVAYGTPVPREGIILRGVAYDASKRPPTVSIDGGIVDSALRVSHVSQISEGNKIVIEVRHSILLPWSRSGRFHLKINIDSEVTEITYKNSNDVIWHR